MHLTVKTTSSLIFVAFLVLSLPAASRAAGLDMPLTIETTSPLVGPLSLAYDGSSLALDAGYLQGTLLGYRWRLGVQPLAWGPSPFENLLYSDRVSLPQLWVSYDYHGFEILPAMHYENFYARLLPRDGSDRYLIGRRYTCGNERWQAGLIETVLLSGGFSPYYLIPYPFFPISVGKVFLTESRVGDPNDANILYGLDIKYAGRRASGYAALMIDEAPLTRVYQGPWRVGVQIGGERREFLGCEDLRLQGEYTAISRYAFTYREGYARGDYLHGDASIGHTLGPDADLLQVRAIGERADSQTWFGLARERHGEGRFGDRWEPAAGQALELLTGTIETTYWLRGGYGFVPADGWRLEFDARAGYVMNLDHVEDQTGMRYNLAVKAVYKF